MAPKLSALALTTLLTLTTLIALELINDGLELGCQVLLTTLTLAALSLVALLIALALTTLALVTLALITLALITSCQPVRHSLRQCFCCTLQCAGNAGKLVGNTLQQLGDFSPISKTTN
jgi:hypothetical protein